MVVLVFAMVCGVYICSICLKQIGIRTNPGFLNVEVIERPCPEPNIEPWEIPYVHYPQPKTYSRYDLYALTLNLGFAWALLVMGFFWCVVGLNASAILCGILLFCQCRDLGVDGLRHC